MFLDKQGRLFGKINLLDLMALLFLLSLAGTVRYAVVVLRHFSLEVVSVEPRRIVAGPGQYVMMQGTGFDQSTTIKLGPFAARTSYLDASRIGIEVNDEIEPGIHTIVVRDGRGRCVVLPDALEVVWVPQISEVKPKILYSTGEGALVDVLGEFFDSRCSVRLGGRELEVVKRVGHTRVQGALKRDDAALPLGQQDVAVISTGGPSAALEQAVTVVPAPQVRSIEPEVLWPGQTVDLLFRGDHLREGTRVWLGKQLIGEARVVGSDRLWIQVTGLLENMEQNLFLDLPEGPKICVLKNVLGLRDTLPVFVVVAIVLDDENSTPLESLELFPEWPLKRPLKPQERLVPHQAQRKNFNRKKVKILQLPVVEVGLPAYAKAVKGGYTYQYKGKPLHIGTPIAVDVHGRTLSGTVVTEPYAVLADDLLKDWKN